MKHDLPALAPVELLGGRRRRKGGAGALAFGDEPAVEAETRSADRSLGHGCRAPKEALVVLEEKLDGTGLQRQLGNDTAALLLLRPAARVPGELGPPKAQGEAEKRPEEGHEDGGRHNLDQHRADA